MPTDNGATPSEGVVTAPTPTNKPVDPPYNPKDVWLKEVKTKVAVTLFTRGRVVD
jgi:hypothetical protein